MFFFFDSRFLTSSQNESMTTFIFWKWIFTFIWTIRLILFINFFFIRFCLISIWRFHVRWYRIMIVVFIVNVKRISFQHQSYRAWIRFRILFVSKSRWDTFWLRFQRINIQKWWSKWTENQTCFERNHFESISDWRNFKRFQSKSNE